MIERVDGAAENSSHTHKNKRKLANKMAQIEVIDVNTRFDSAD